MITVEKRNQLESRKETQYVSFEFRGLSTDTKPTTEYSGDLIANGSIFIEIDTAHMYFYDEENTTWLGGEEE